MKFIIGEHISFINPTGHSQPTAVHRLKSALDGNGNNICSSVEGVSAKIMAFPSCSSTASPAGCQLSSLLISVGQARLKLTQLRDTSVAKEPWNPEWCHKEWLTNRAGRTGDGQAWLLAVPSTATLLFFSSSEPKISQGAPSYEDAVRGGAAEVDLG